MLGALFFWFTLAIHLTGVTAEAETGGKISGAMYGASKLARNSLALSRLDLDQVALIKSEVIQEVLFSGENFWKILSSGSPETLTSAFRERLVNQLEESLIIVWADPGETPCQEESPLACAISKPINDIIAISYMVDPCVWNPRISTACKTVLRGQEGILKEEASIKNALRRAVAHGAVKFSSVLSNSKQRRAARERLEKLLVDSRNIFFRSRAACPGPFPKLAQLALTDARLMRPEENSYVKTCATRYARVLHGAGSSWSQLPEPCREIVDPRRWGAWRPMVAAQPVRCGIACQKLLCGSDINPDSSDYFEGADVNRKPRLIWFERDPVLDLPESACAGPDPIRMEYFLRHSVLPFLVKPEFAAHPTSELGIYEYKSSWDGCVKALSPTADKAPPRSKSTEGAGHGEDAFLE